MSKELVDIVKDTTVRFADHEILLSFCNDSGAEKFEGWWDEEGKMLFDKFCEDFSADYDH